MVRQEEHVRHPKHETLCRGEEGILKEGDINRDEVVIYVKRIACNPIEGESNQEDTLSSFG